MPIYEYRCEACGALKELIVRPGEETRPSCARCRKKMRRVISPTAFILKGSGWYVTDYPSQERKKGLDAEKSSGAAPQEQATERKGSAVAEKPAPKPEPKAPAAKKGKRPTA